MKRSELRVAKTDSKAGSPSDASECDTIFTKNDPKRLASPTHFPRGKSTTQPILKQSENKKSNRSDAHQTSYNVYGNSGIPLRLDKSILESEIANLTDKKSEVEKNFWSNASLSLSKPLKGTLASRLSPLVLAKRLGFSLCQVFELIEAGSIICRNGLIPAEEAERLLQPKIEKV